MIDGLPRWPWWVSAWHLFLVLGLGIAIIDFRTKFIKVKITFHWNKNMFNFHIFSAANKYQIYIYIYIYIYVYMYILIYIYNIIIIITFNSDGKFVIMHFVHFCGGIFSWISTLFYSQGQGCQKSQTIDNLTRSCCSWGFDYSSAPGA